MIFISFVFIIYYLLCIAPLARGIQVDFPSNVNYSCVPTDTRIKSYFLIVNDTVVPNIELPVVAMSDGGNSGQLTLPARKIHFLGLTPKAGKAGKFGVKGTIAGVTAVKLVFVPHVTIKFFFSRDNSITIEARECLAFATCQETEYNNFITALVTASTTNTVTGPATPPPAPITQPLFPIIETPPTAIAKVTLSPAYHRPVGSPDEQVALGHEVLAKLSVHADFGHSVLWVEEEVVQYDE